MKKQNKWALYPTTAILAMTVLTGLGGCGADQNSDTKADNDSSAVQTSAAQQSSVAESASTEEAAVTEVPAVTEVQANDDPVSAENDVIGLEEDFVNNEDFYGLLSAEYAATGYISFGDTDIREKLGILHGGHTVVKVCGDLVLYDGTHTSNKDFVLINLKTKSAVSIPQPERYAVSQKYAYLSNNGKIYVFDANGELINSVDTDQGQYVWAPEGAAVYGAVGMNVYFADETLSNIKQIEMPEKCFLGMIGPYGSDRMIMRRYTNRYQEAVMLLYDMTRTIIAV